METISAAFLDAVIKRSEDADVILTLCGRIRFQRAMAAVIEQWLTCPPGGQEPSPGTLEVGSINGEVVVNHPDLRPDANGVGHIVFSPKQARNLARLLKAHASAAEKQLKEGAL